MNFSWMAWTLPTALFFVAIFLMLVGMGVWEYFSPGGNPRIGILRFETTRGDRLFMSLLGSRLHSSRLVGSTSANLWWALGLSLVYAIGVFSLRLRSLTSEDATNWLLHHRTATVNSREERQCEGSLLTTTAFMLLAITGSAHAGHG